MGKCTIDVFSMWACQEKNFVSIRRILNTIYIYILYLLYFLVHPSKDGGADVSLYLSSCLLAIIYIIYD